MRRWRLCLDHSQPYDSAAVGAAAPSRLVVQGAHRTTHPRSASSGDLGRGHQWSPDRRRTDMSPAGPVPDAVRAVAAVSLQPAHPVARVACAGVVSGRAPGGCIEGGASRPPLRRALAAAGRDGHRLLHRPGRPFGLGGSLLPALLTRAALRAVSAARRIPGTPACGSRDRGEPAARRGRSTRGDLDRRAVVPLPPGHHAHARRCARHFRRARCGSPSNARGALGGPATGTALSGPFSNRALTFRRRS